MHGKKSFLNLLCMQLFYVILIFLGSNQIFLPPFTYFILQEEFLQRIGARHPHFDFLSTVSSKCSFNIFSLENVQHIVDIFSDGFGHRHWEASAKLLLVRA